MDAQETGIGYAAVPESRAQVVPAAITGLELVCASDLLQNPGMVELILEPEPQVFKRRPVALPDQETDGPPADVFPSALQPEPAPLWHEVKTRPGVVVTLRQTQKRQRMVRLSVRSEAPGWNPRWVRWTYPRRHVAPDQGGEALSALDILSEDDRELQMLLLAEDSERVATLEFAAALDGQTYPDNYPFEIVVTDVPTGAVLTEMGELRLRHPAANWMRHLPAIYSEMPQTDGDQTIRRSARRGMNAFMEPYEDRPFFERFLRGFEDSLEPMSQLLATIYRYFDPDTVPADFLSWLATWVALALDENWPELKRRSLIREAVILYRRRGTRWALSRYLEIYTGFKPQINDHPQTGMFLSANTKLGPETRLGHVLPFCFVVTLAVPDPSLVNEQIARDIIEANKPAHAAYELSIVEQAAGAV